MRRSGYTNLTFRCLGNAGEVYGSSSEVAGEIFEALLVGWPEGVTAKHVKTGVIPTHHVFDDGICDFALSFQDFENCMLKCLFKLAGLWR